MCTVSLHLEFYVGTQNSVLLDSTQKKKKISIIITILPHQQLPISRHNFSGKIQYYWLSGWWWEWWSSSSCSWYCIFYFSFLRFLSSLLSRNNIIIHDTYHIQHRTLLLHLWLVSCTSTFLHTISTSSSKTHSTLPLRIHQAYMHATEPHMYINIWWRKGWNYEKNYEANAIIDLDGGAVQNIYYL